MSSHGDTGVLREETSSKGDVRCQGRESGVKEGPVSTEAFHPVRSLVNTKGDHCQHIRTGFALSGFTASISISDTQCIRQGSKA